MPSTYTVNLGIEKPATGEQSGTWGDTTNVNFDIIDQAVNGSERVTLTSAGTSGSPNDLNIVNGSTTSSEGRNKWIEIYSASDLGGSAYVRLVPNDAEKILFIRNSLAGSQSVLLFQGTYNASNDIEIPAGVDMVVKFDGAGASATVTDVFTKLRATEITTPTLTAGTADINGGSVDGATVGAASASTGAFTTLTASTSLNIAASTTIDGVLDEDNMASDSATKLATQQSIKAYVDSQVGTVDTLAEILANGNTSGANNLIIDNGQALTSNTINETTAGSGVTIDSVLLKDDVVNATDIETGSISANDGTAAATIANSTGNFTITNFISNSVDIGGGAIDGTNIGASSAATGTFTTFTSTGIDDNATSTAITIDSSENVGIGTASPSTILDVREESTGGSTQIRVYNTDNSNTTTQTAALFLSPDSRGNGALVFAEKENADFSTSASRDVALVFSPVLNNSQTEAMRIDSSGNVGIGTTSPSSTLHLYGTGTPIRLNIEATTGRVESRLDNTSGAFIFGIDDSGGAGFGSAYSRNIYSNGAYPMLFWTNNAERMRIDSSGNVGIGTVSPSELLDVGDHTSVGNRNIRISQRVGTGGLTYGGLQFYYDNTAGTEGVNAAIYYASGPLRNDGELTFYTGVSGSASERLRIDHNGNVGIGTTSPGTKLHIVAGTSGSALTEGLRVSDNVYTNIQLLSGSADGEIRVGASGVMRGVYKAQFAGTRTANNFSLGTNSTDAITIDTSQNVGIGTSPSYILDVDVGAPASSDQLLGRFSSQAGVRSIAFVWDDSASTLGIGTQTSHPIAFHINGSSAEKMRLDTSGNLLVGATSASAKFQVVHNSAATPVALLQNTNGSASGVGGIQTSLNSTANNTNCFHFKGTTQGVASYFLYGDGTSSFTSDERQKKNVVNTRNGYLDDLKRLRVVDYHWNNQEDTEDKSIGLIAQEVEQVFPHLVIEHEMEGVGPRKNLKGSEFTFVLIKAIQEQQAMIDELKAEVAALKGE
jgi:hypothetical protein